MLLFDWTKDAVLVPSRLETGLAEFQGKPAVVLRCDCLGSLNCMEVSSPEDISPSNENDDIDFFNAFPGECT